MVKIAFIILHYNTYNDTIRCAKSILKNVPNSPIIIVDNSSPNGSGQLLKDYFEKEPLITVLLLKDNFGFSKGNNAGIRYAQEHYSPFFIAVLNNDTVILENNYLDIVIEEYKRSKFAVLGPQIINTNGEKDSNPVEYVVDSKTKIIVLLLKREIKWLFNKLHLNGLLHNVGESSNKNSLYNNCKRYEDVKLHGACWIFSPNFFKEFDGLNEGVFLFFEEDILYIEARNKNLKMVYNPQLKILHLEDSATKSITKNIREKNLFVLRNEIKSLKFLYRFLTDNRRGYIDCK